MTDWDWRYGFQAFLLLMGFWFGQELWRINRSLRSIARSLRKLARDREEESREMD